MVPPKLGFKAAPTSRRDAIHVAVVPARAGEALMPGEHVFLEQEDSVLTCFSKGVPKKPRVGIVDPFLDQDIEAGEYVWVCLYPGSVRSIRHDWSHPAIDGDESVKLEESVDFMNEAAALLDMKPEELIDAATDWVRHDETFVAPTTCYNEIDWREFWLHYERVTGFHCPREKEHDFPYGCSC